MYARMTISKEVLVRRHLAQSLARLCRLDFVLCFAVFLALDGQWAYEVSLPVQGNLEFVCLLSVVVEVQFFERVPAVVVLSLSSSYPASGLLLWALVELHHTFVIALVYCRIW